MTDPTAQSSVRTTPHPADSQTRGRQVVAVRGPARRLRRFYDLLAPSLPASDLAVALIPVRHDPDTTSLVDHLRRLGILEPGPLWDGLALEAGSVCVVEPDYHAFAAERVFSFLAREHGANVACVSLCGCTDGLPELRELKKHGGTIIVEDSARGSCDAFLHQVIESGLAHYVVPIENMPAMLLDRTRTTPVPTHTAEASLYEVLRQAALPMMLASHAGHNPIRVWVPGCGAGDEAYRLAMAVLDRIDACRPGHHVEVFATDAHIPSLKTAQQGLIEGPAMGWMQAYLEPEDGTWRAGGRLRDSVMFAVHNFVLDPPLAGFDIIDCRGILAALKPGTSRKLIRTLVFGLSDGGLLLCPSGYTVPAAGMLESVSEGAPVFRRIPASGGRFMAPRAWVDLAGAPLADPPSMARIEGLLQEHRDALLGVLDELPVVAYLLGADYSIAFANKSFRRLFGSPEGKRCYQIFQDRAAPCDDCTMCFSMAAGETRFREWTTAGGLSFAVQGSVVIGEGGRPFVLEVGVDITQRKQTETALLHSERFIQKVADTAPFVIAVYDCAAGRFIYANSQVAALLGYMPEEVRATTFEEFLALIHSKDRLAYRLALRGLFGNDRPEAVEIEFRFRAAAGDWRWLHARINTFSRTPDGEPRELLATAHDITDGKTAEAALVESEEHLRAVFSEAEIGIAVVDEDGRAVKSNRALCEIFDYSARELTAKPLLDFAHPSDVHRNRRLFQDLLRGEIQSFETESRFFRRTGETVWCQITVWLLRNARDDEQFAIAVVQDITDRRRAEEDRRKFEIQIQQTQKLESLGVMAGGIAHDFNNLLMGILGNASLVLDAPGTDNGVRDQVDEIGKAAEHAAELCRQLLAYAGKSVFVLRPIDLSALVDDMRHLLLVSAKRRAELSFTLARKLPAINGDATQIRQILMNLVINAAEAMQGNDGVVDIRTGVQTCSERYLADTFLHSNATPGPYVYVQVADTGEGMDPKTLARIFDPFFTTKFTGRGLGLAAVVGIVKAHRGAIKVESSPGQGTTFRVLFPATTAAAAAEPAKRHDSAMPKLSGTVLVVDDEDTVRKVAQKMLERVGLHVLLAQDGLEGLEVFMKHQDAISAVILDLTMPRMNGEQVYRELRRRKKDVPIIISSGYDEREAMDRVGAGCSAMFIQKPYKVAALLEKLRAAMYPDEAPPSV